MPIHDTPKRSATMPKREAWKVSVMGIRTCPPTPRAANKRSASASSSAVSDNESSLNLAPPSQVGDSHRKRCGGQALPFSDLARRAKVRFAPSTAPYSSTTRSVFATDRNSIRMESRGFPPFPVTFTSASKVSSSTSSLYDVCRPEAWPSRSQHRRSSTHGGNLSRWQPSGLYMTNCQARPGLITMGGSRGG